MTKLFTLLFFLVSLQGCNLVYWDEDFDSYKDLSNSIPHPFHAIQKNTSESGNIGNEMMSINSGLVALQLRIDMIRRAQSSIEVEYFIFTPDKSGQLIVQELLKARKNRNVKIRILIDKSASVLEFDEKYAKELHKAGIEVRYYNAAPIYSISTINFRNHRKLLVIDDKEAITGGRNIEDDYFDLSATYNFLDRDIYVKGNIVPTIRQSFDTFWKHEITQRPDFAITLSNEERNLVNDFYSFTPDDRKTQTEIEEIARPLLAKKKVYDCPITTFTSDAPGGSFWSRFADPYSDKYRFLRKTIFDKVSTVDEEIIVASPYMLNNKKSAHLMNQLLEKKVKITLYTNSLASTDATYVAARLYDHVYDWEKMGINIYLHNGEPMNETPTVNESIQSARWGMHSKTQIYKSRKHSAVMVSTYNIDNRSNHYNAEMGLFCEGSDGLVKEVEQSILSRAKKGYKITGYKQAVNSKGESVNVYGAGDPDTSKMKYMWLPSWFFEFLL